MNVFLFTSACLPPWRLNGGPLQTASLLCIQQAAIIPPSNSCSLARQLSSRAEFHHYRSQRHAALIHSVCLSRETPYAGAALWKVCQH